MTYHLFLNFNKFETLEPIDSLSELSPNCDIITEVTNLLKEGQHWHRSRLALIGNNWADDLNFKNVNEVFMKNCPSYLSEIFDFEKDADNLLGRAYLIAPQRDMYSGDSVRYIFNHSLKKYVDMDDMLGNPLTIHPLALLLLIDGKDHEIDGDSFGHWAGHILSASNALIAGFDKIDIGFRLKTTS